MFLWCHISVSELIHTLEVNPRFAFHSTLFCILCSCFVTVIAFIGFELLFLLFVFELFVYFLGNVLFLGNTRRFSNLLSKSSSRSISVEEAESAIGKGWWLKVHMHYNKVNNLNQKTSPIVRFFTIINGTGRIPFAMTRLRWNACNDI